MPFNCSSTRESAKEYAFMGQNLRSGGPFSRRFCERRSLYGNPLVVVISGRILVCIPASGGRASFSRSGKSKDETDLVLSSVPSYLAQPQA